MDSCTIKKAFSLDNKTTILTVCPNPNCHFTYEPTFQSDLPIPIYSDTCNHHEFRGRRKCGTPLLKSQLMNGHMIHLPIKPLIAFSFKDWLGGLLSCSGFEAKMDDAWANSLTPSKEMNNIFDGEILWNFKGFDGQHSSTSPSGKEGWYVFSLCVDYFNPLGNKQAGKKKSIGLMSLVCLNLPPEMQYKLENMFLFGVIPGPSKLPLTCLNHYVHPLVDMLLKFWFTGIWFFCTYAYYYRRVVQCALVCIVSKLPAAHRISSFASIHHTQMCTMCHCTWCQHDSFNDSFTTLGMWWTNEEIHDSAQLYLDAVDEKERSEAIHNSGIRWSELFHLSYFNVSCFVVVNAMHNLFLGLVQEHFNILGTQLNNMKSRTTPSIDIPEESLNKLNEHKHKSVNQLINILEAPIKKELKSQAGYDIYFKWLSTQHRAALELLCMLVGAPLKLNSKHVNKSKLNKLDLIHVILTWVSLMPLLQYFMLIRFV